MNLPPLVFFCGRMGAGKSTKARALAEEYSAILISEDEWLGELYPNQITTLDDYARLSQGIRPLVERLVHQLLDRGNPGTDTEAMFHVVTRYFHAPEVSEGLNLSWWNDPAG